MSFVNIILTSYNYSRVVLHVAVRILSPPLAFLCILCYILFVLMYDTVAGIVFERLICLIKKDYNSVPVEIANRIRDMIFLQSRFLPGDKLPNEMDLAQELGVSRNSVREAIKILTSNHVLRVERGRGTFVEVTPSELADVFGISHIQDRRQLYIDWFDTRIALELMIAASAAERASSEEIASINYWDNLCAEKIRAGTDYAKEDCQFHIAIAIASHNCVIERMMPMLAVAVEDSTAMNHRENAAATKENALYFHHQIARYIEKRNPHVAAAMMLAHLEMGLDRLKYNR